MGWLFKTPGDDATEATLRALHTQNMLAVLLSIIVGTSTALGVSFFEATTEISVWENTVEWFYMKIRSWVG